MSAERGVITLSRKEVAIKPIIIEGPKKPAKTGILGLEAWTSKSAASIEDRAVPKFSFENSKTFVPLGLERIEPIENPKISLIKTKPLLPPARIDFGKVSLVKPEKKMPNIDPVLIEKQRVSDKAQAARVIKAWDALSSMKDKGKVQEKVSAILQQKQVAEIVPEVDKKLTQAVTAREAILPKFKKDELIQTIRKLATDDKVSLEVIYAVIKEQCIKMKHEPVPLETIFQILLTESTTAQKTITKERKEIREIQIENKIPGIKTEQRRRSGWVGEEQLITIEQKDGDIICFYEDIAPIIVKDKHKKKISNEEVNGKFLDADAVTKPGVQGIVNKAEEKGGTNVVETDGKVKLEEICPVCLLVLQANNLKMEVTAHQKEERKKEQVKQFTIVSFSKKNFSLAA